MSQQLTTEAEESGPLILRGGSVYSAADPFATAVLVDDGRILWVGQEAGADSLIDHRSRVELLEGLLLTPGFTALVPDPPDEAERVRLLSAGYTAWLTEHDLQQGPTVVHGGDPLPEESHTVLVLADPEGEWVGTARLALSAGIRAGLLARVDPQREGEDHNPWHLAVQGISAGEKGLSVRGTFTLQTRGVHRVLGSLLQPMLGQNGVKAHPLAGQIVPEAPASMVGWRAEALMVQTADTRIAAWSTDPRARTPLLPELGGHTRPRAEWAVLGSDLHRWDR